MKKILLTLFVLSFTLCLNAQMWCPPGATWHYRVYAGFFPYYDGNLMLGVTNTVTLNNIVCNNITGTFNGKTMTPSSPITTINGYVNFQTYENNKVVYIYDSANSVFDTIANFNANFGDKWLIVRFPFANCPNNSVRTAVTVLDTGHVVINSIILKRIKVSVPSSAGTYTLNIIEKVGALSGFLFPFIYSNCTTDGPVYGDFVCYSDNNFLLYDPSAADCAYLPTGIQENSNSQPGLKLYPNPNSGVLKIDMDEATNLSVYNALGVLIYEKNYPGEGNYSVDLSDFASGIYHLKAKTARGISYSKILKE